MVHQEYVRGIETITTIFQKQTKKRVELKAGGRLVISTTIIKDMVCKVAVSIKNFIDAILKEIDMKTLNAILMVGGFSNSPAF